MTRTLLLVVGVVLLTFGLAFLADDLGVLPFAHDRAAAGHSVWAYRGVTLATAGGALMMLARSALLR